MKFNWADLAVMAAMAAAGFAICYAALRRRQQQALAEQQQATERQLTALADAIRTLEDKVAELSRIPALQTSAVPEAETAGAHQTEEVSASVAVEQEDNLEDEEVPAEMMGVLAAAVTAFLGKQVRILSARKLQSPRQVTSPWSQQGRVFVLASHNLRARG